ncbi:MAG TPA: UDP-N-acetylmuramoyl-L-alanine--D-glutamate ligase [Anaerohalosphaeraceae bacterium]|nr:UDP-N-acetylmuramoyl-L-alanine--D-glutamate ligase [Anaerohalosphaeraceae bacterium]HPB92867.1 UDP-N-acetylmuramoyl-L-alanine--D-glutamate ligase [Anaerohalosphaeraceae bacterium]HRT23223.1 UDP-N-acetylmuramoyl-L-alanine--D-glutamate ligase [Anaerohalosphaeraceae bacterium]
MIDLKNKRVLIMGLGSFGGGADSVRFACEQGAEVTVTDLAEESKLRETIETLGSLPVRWHLGGHSEEDFRRAEVVIVNPAVTAENPYLQLARQAGAVITSQVELFFERCPARIVAVTGSNGKSTTTALTAHLLAGGGDSAGRPYRRVYLSGNIGNRPLLGLLEDLRSEDIVVLEISSFQLEQLGPCRRGADAAVLTNLSPNHLDRHSSFETYCAAKEILFSNQKPNPAFPPVSIFNGEDTVGLRWFEKYSQEGFRRCVLFRAGDVEACYREKFRLPGQVNLQNLAAALAVAKVFEVDREHLQKAVSTFEGLEHRMQLVSEKDGVRWYDDSKATTPISTMAALNGIEEPKILIAGGYDKHISFDELGRCIAQRCKAVVLIGQTADKISEAIQSAGPSQVIVKRAKTMEEAVICCSKMAQKGDIVLMSPACASFDMFKNYQERGKVFQKAVLNLCQ